MRGDVWIYRFVDMWVFVWLWIRGYLCEEKVRGLCVVCVWFVCGLSGGGGGGVPTFGVIHRALSNVSAT